MLRFVVCALLACASSWAQPAVRLKTGDPAPRLQFAKVMQTPGPSVSDWDMRGKVVVVRLTNGIMFDDPQSVRWNELAARFVGRPVEFVLVTSEPESMVKRILRDAPVSGWIVLDPEESTARTFGMHAVPCTIVIDAMGRVAGFARGSRVDEAMIQSVLNGEPRGFEAEPEMLLHPQEPMPAYSPSYEVHISPTTRTDNGTSISAGNEKWYARGFGLRQIIMNMWQVSPDRLDFPASLDTGKRYDFAVVLPTPERDIIPELVKQAIQKEFGVTVTRESRDIDVYVMTAPNGKSAELEELPQLRTGQRSSSGMSVTDARIVAHGMRMEELVHTLQRRLGRPVIDETNLTGRYNFVVSVAGSGSEAFMQMLRDKLGLVLTPERRPVEITVVRAANR
jgi:uncharacterized protein (TIGR03435 family)